MTRKTTKKEISEKSKMLFCAVQFQHVRYNTARHTLNEKTKK